MKMDLPMSRWAVTRPATETLVPSGRALVSGVAWRVQVESGLGIEALAQSPEELVPQLRFVVLRAALAPGEPLAEQAG